VLDFVQTLETSAYEAFAHEQSYTDGTIFRNIRLYSRKGNAIEEDKWWARLTETKKKDLRQLISSNKYHNIPCRNKENNESERLIDALDDLLELPGLWLPIQLGTLHRLHGLRCREVNELWSDGSGTNIDYVGTLKLLEVCEKCVGQHSIWKISKSRR
jgi:hypothetical protein